MALRRAVSKVRQSAHPLLQQVSVLDAPFSLGSKLVGSKYFPDMIREYGLDTMLHEEAEAVSNVGWSGTGKSKNHLAQQESVGAYCQDLHDAIMANPTCLNDFLLVLGGDHSLSIGTVNAINKIQKNKTGVVWVDAHADVNTSETSPSSNVHGMSLAFLMGLEKNLLLQQQWGWFRPCGLQPSDVAYIGLRDVDDGEKDIIKSLGITVFTVDDIEKHGIDSVMDQVQKKLAHKEKLHLSFDIDVLDPKVAPHTGTHATGGLTEMEGLFVCEALGSSGRLQSMELVEVNPIIEQHVPVEQTLDIAMRLIHKTVSSVREA